MELSSFNIKKILKYFLLLQETETPKKNHFISGNGNSKKASYISGDGTFLYFRKRNFLIFWKRYIQNPDVFRTRSIFRTLVYLEPETYSKYCQTWTMERFAKNSYLAHFFILPEIELSSLIFLLYFRR